MTVLVADANDRSKIYAIAFAIVQIPASLFLLAIMVPLYKLAKERTALYILLSKTCFNIVSQLCNCLFQNLYWVFHTLNDDSFFVAVYMHSPFSQCLSMIVAIHVLALALNRFVAVFLAFKYMGIFTKRNTFIYILVVWAIGTVLGLLLPRDGSFHNLNIYITNANLFGCSFAYCAMLLKFVQEKFRTNVHHANSQTEKNRIVLSAVCFLSILPEFISHVIQWALQIFQPETGSLLSISLSILIICNIGLSQVIEELCLILFCADFCKLIRKQFRFCCCCRGSTASSSSFSSTTPITPIDNNGNHGHRLRTVTV